MDLQQAANQAVLERSRRLRTTSRLEGTANACVQVMRSSKYEHPDWEDEPEVDGYLTR